MASPAISSFELNIPKSELEDLKRRLAATRWPPRESVPDWSQGAPLSKVQALCSCWHNTYDWRRCEALQFLAAIHLTNRRRLYLLPPHPVESGRCNAHIDDTWLVRFSTRISPHNRASD
jgi:hypothetical protein